MNFASFYTLMAERNGFVSVCKQVPVDEKTAKETQETNDPRPPALRAADGVGRDLRSRSR